MEVVIGEPAELARIAADAVERLVHRRPDAVLGLATGSSPLALYDELAARVAAGRLSLARTRAFLLDEYVGLPPDHPQSYRQVIARELLDRVDLPPASVHVPDAGGDDVPAACARFEATLAAAGGIDLQVLGLGTDGHLAFNEPGSSLAARTRIKTLTHSTREDNARFFDGDVDAVPTHAITQGLGTILESRHAVVLAAGEHKAEAVAQMVEGPVSASWPATVLQHHPHATVLVDAAAASRLRRADHYREVWAGKPAWQGI